MSETAMQAMKLLLQAGPATGNDLAQRIGCHPRTARDALHRLEAHGLSQIVGRAPKPEGSSAPAAYVWAPGPAIRAWIVREQSRAHANARSG